MTRFYTMKGTNQERLVVMLLALLALTAISIGSGNAESAKQLVSYGTTGNYHLHESALQDIEELPGPLLVLAAVGDARIGKSTFLNMIALHWDRTFPQTTPFRVGDTTLACTHGLWIHTHGLPEGGSLVLVDVEGDNLGNDVVTEQLSALTAVISSYILVFVREVVSNTALEFLYHTTKLGKMYPDSDNFPHLGVAIRDALNLNPTFRDRHSEVVYSITSPTHKDGNDELRSEIAAVFPPNHISAFEVEYQDRKQLENLQGLRSGPYYDSVQTTVSHLKKTMSPKLTPVNGMVMNGSDLVGMIRRLFAALENGDITALETAYERLEKQMCDAHYSEWIAPLLKMNEDEFMSREEHHTKEFVRHCKIDSSIEHIKQEIDIRKSGIIREREERKKTRKAIEEREKAKEEERKALAARREAEKLQKKAQEQRDSAEKELQKAKERLREKEEEQRMALEKLKKEQEEGHLARKKLEEDLKKAEADRRKAEADLRKAEHRLQSGTYKKSGGGFSDVIDFVTKVVGLFKLF